MLPLVLEAIINSVTGFQIKWYRNGEAKALAEKPILSVPACAADMHTSIGRRAIAQFSEAVKQKHARFFEAVPDVGSHAKLLGMAMFHAEGSRLDRWLENEAIAQYRERIEEAELQALGLPNRTAQRQLYQVLKTECRLLWRIRKSHLLSAFGKGRGNK